MTEPNNTPSPSDSYDRFPIVSADPFNWRQLQFGALRMLGYPAVLEPATIADAYRQAYGDDGEEPPSEEALRKYQEVVGADVVRPVATDPAFEPYVTDLSFSDMVEVEITLERGEAPGLLNLTTGQLSQLNHHPAWRLVQSVDRGRPIEVASYIRHVRQHGEPRMVRPLPGGVLPVARRSYMRAAERYATRISQPHLKKYYSPELSSDRAHMTDRDIARYKRWPRRVCSP